MDWEQKLIGIDVLWLVPTCVTSGTSYTVLGIATVGGGLDIKISDKIDIRAVQINLNRINVDDNSYLYSKLGISTGVVFKF